MNELQEIDHRYGNGAATPPARASQATQVEQARAIAEVRAAVMIAMDRPRDRTAAISEMREVCSIMGLAERAFFRVPRGAEYVNGESIHLARELARVWGNVDYGVKELARDDIRGQSELLAFAWDLQTNARSEITFIVPHVRGSGDRRKLLTGSQEIYENNASFAGRRLREVIFAVLPVWFKSEAAELCHRTLQSDGGDKPLVQRVADLRGAFESIGVTAAQLEQKRGRRIDEFLPEDIAALRVVYGSLKRGEVTAAEEFPTGEAGGAAVAAGSRLDAIESTIVEARETPQEAATEQEAPERPDTAPATEQPSSAPPIAAAGEPRDLLGAQPTENLAVPLDRNPSIQDCEYFARQIVAMLDEKPRTSQRTASIRLANEGALKKLKAALPDRYDEVMAALHGGAAG